MVFLPIAIAKYGIEAEFSGRGRHSLFLWSSWAGVIVTVGIGEYAISLVKLQKSEMQQKLKAK